MHMQVFACAAAVAAAEAHLQALLPQLAAAAGVASLSYVAIQNQGSYMVELPASRTSVPQGWEKVRGTFDECCLQLVLSGVHTTAVAYLAGFWCTLLYTS
jgi:hypothetical protein